MPQPLPPRPRLLYFLRQEDDGSAAVDAAVASELRRLAAVDVRLCRSGGSVRTLGDLGHPVFDLGLGADAPLLDRLVRSVQSIASVEPDGVVSHGELAALPAAKAFGLPVLLITDAFPTSEVLTDTLRYADEILFTGHRGVFPEPPEAGGRIRYIGPLIGTPSATRAERARAREALGLPPDATVISVLPGAASEQRAPILHLVVPAFELLEWPEKRLVWVGGPDYTMLQAHLGDVEGMLVIREPAQVGALMIASDVVITKAARGATIDLARLGVPSVSLWHGRDGVDQAIASRTRNNLALDARGIDGCFLAQALGAAVSRARLPGPSAGPFTDAAGLARELQGGLRRASSGHPAPGAAAEA